MFRYIKALEEVLKANGVENYKEDGLKFYTTLKVTRLSLRNKPYLHSVAFSFLNLTTQF